LRDVKHLVPVVTRHQRNLRSRLLRTPSDQVAVDAVLNGHYSLPICAYRTDNRPRQAPLYFDNPTWRVGLQDGLLASNERVHDLLNAYGIKHDWETYKGDHGNRLGERIDTRMLPFFSEHLAFK
jgi:hypothetical protein